MSTEPNFQRRMNMAARSYQATTEMQRAAADAHRQGKGIVARYFYRSARHAYEMYLSDCAWVASCLRLDVAMEAAR
jgi:hypothetical protein